MTFPGLGGQQQPPQNAPGAQTPVPGVTPGVPPILTVTQIVITPGGVLQGIFTYSSRPPAAGTLIASSNVAAAGTDRYGNHFLAGMSSYAATFATSVQSGFVAFYSGSLAAGWTLESSVAGDVAGNLQVNATGQLQLVGSGGVAVTGSFTVNGSGSTGGPDSTGFFNTQGLASGSYGSTHQHTLPNFPTATHGHPL